jgi:hypothetical protein
MSVRGLITAASAALLLALGGLAVAAILQDTPALVPDLRVEGPRGDWRVGAGDRLYDRSAYLREQAIAHLQAAARLEDADAALDSARTARDAARRSVQLAPADPYGWLLVAWGETILGNDGVARAALERSWSLAPRSLALAQDRLFVAEALGMAASGLEEPAVARSILADVATLERAAPRTWDDVSEALPGIARLARAREPLS